MRKIRLFVPFVILSSSSQRVNEPSNEHRSFLILEKNRTVPGTARKKERERERPFVQDRILSSDSYNEFQRDLSPRERFPRISRNFFSTGEPVPTSITFTSRWTTLWAEYISRMEAISGVSMRNTDYARHVLPPRPLFSIADGIRELLERRETRIYPICNNYPR